MKCVLTIPTGYNKDEGCPSNPQSSTMHNVKFVIFLTSTIQWTGKSGMNILDRALQLNITGLCNRSLNRSKKKKYANAKKNVLLDTCSYHNCSSNFHAC